MINRLSTLSRVRSGLKGQPAPSSTKRTSEASPDAQIILRGESLRLLTTEDVAALFGIAPATIVWWRSQRQGPPWVRLGRGKRSPIRYRPEAVEAYITQMESGES